MPLDGSEVTTLGITGGPQMPYGEFLSSAEEPQVYLFDFEPDFSAPLDFAPDFQAAIDFEPAFEVI